MNEAALIRKAQGIVRTLGEAYFCGHGEPADNLRDLLLQIDNSLMCLPEYQRAQDRLNETRLLLDRAGRIA
jgi:hypothetical protein